MSTGGSVPDPHEQHLRADRRIASDIDTRLAAIEAREEERDRLIREIHAEVLGATGGRVGSAEVIRRQGERIERLERIVLWGGTLYTGVLSLVLGAWALRLVGPPSSGAAIIYQQLPPAIHGHAH